MRFALLALTSLMLSPHALADTVRIDQPWVRATAPGQRVAGAFADLTADADMTLVSASSPVSRIVELHSMSMDGDVMVMRPLASIPLTKDKTVSLKPGGMHLMLIDLKNQIKPGDTPPVILTLKNQSGDTQQITVELEVRQGSGKRPH